MKLIFTTVKLSDNLGYPSIVSAIAEMNKKYNDELYLLNPIISQKENQLINHYMLKRKEFSIFKLKGISKYLIGIIYSFILNKSKYKAVYNNNILNELSELRSFDAIIDLAGIDFTDKFISRNLLKNIINIFIGHYIWMLGKYLGIPVIKYTCAIGPCDLFTTKLNIKFNNRYCDLFYVRDEESLNIYKKLKLKRQVKLVPDTAFLMPVEQVYNNISCNLNNYRGRIVGIAASHQLKKRVQNYKDIMVDVINNILKMGFHVLLIPNENSNTLKNDDRTVCKEIYDEINNKKSVEILDVDNIYPNQIKAIISECDYIITSRYHTLIAALSTKRPVLSLSWHHKYKEALKLFGLEKYVIENYEFKSENIISKFMDLIENREQFEQNIEVNIKWVQEEVTAAYDYMHNMLTNRRN